tara:strand:+ start:1338 stop:1676 length:339 start_codon:yes stop_codon:yes gene_type:complete
MGKFIPLQLEFSIALFLMLVLYGCQDAQDVEYQESPAEKAKNLYIIHCSRCHGVSGDLGASGSKNLKLSTFLKEDIEYIIKNGKGVMPAYKDILNSDQKISDISDHVISLRD